MPGETSSKLATLLTIAMLTGRGIRIVDPDNGAQMPEPRAGTLVAGELCGGLLVRYLRTKQVGLYRDGASEVTYVTPTAYTATEAIEWLYLPDPLVPRTHALLLNPERVPWIQGPMWVAGRGGIQYVLPQGFPREAIVVPGAPTGRWELPIS